MKIRPLQLLAPALMAAACLLIPQRLAAAPGDLDLTFNKKGWRPAGPLAAADILYRIGLQSDGRIVGVGWRVTTLGEATVVYRMTQDGTPDPSFNGNGRAVAPATLPSNSCKFVGFQSNGRIITAGTAVFGTNNIGVLLLGYRSDGQLDTAFGAGSGFVTVPTGMDETYGLVIQPDDKILISAGRGGLLRFLPNGALDVSFGTGGRTPRTPDAEGTVDCLAVQPDGGIVFGGLGDDEILLKRMTPAGVLDSSFGNSGRASIPMSGKVTTLYSLAVQSDGRILAGGINGTPGTNEGTMLAARFLPNGSPDLSFNGTGWNECDVRPGGPDIAYALMVEHNGRIILAGNSFDTATADTCDVGLARFLPNGTLDNSFGTGGAVRSDFEGVINDCRCAALLPGRGRVVAGALHMTDPENPQYLLARYEVSPAGMSVEQPRGAPLYFGPGTRRDFGAVVPAVAFMDFAIRNDNLTPLSAVSVSIEQESHPGEFTLNGTIAGTLASGADTTFILSFRPDSTPGPRTARIRITSSDPINSPWLIPLSGSRATPMQAWRYAWFGSTDDTGAGADLNDFDRDGLPNILEYATGSDPHRHTPVPGALTVNGGAVEFAYSRNKAALTELNFQVETAATPAGPWSAAGIPETILTDDNSTQSVKASLPVAPAVPALFARLRVTRLQ